jgi:MFS family permease
MQKYVLKFWNTEDIPHEAKILTAVTSIRWIGWGFAESLIPVLLYSFGHTFAEAGLLRSTYDIAFIIALPLVGVLADKTHRATTLVLIGLLLYLFCGVAYLLAGIMSAVVFIVLARGINGVAYAFDAVGRNTCVRRHTP